MVDLGPLAPWRPSWMDDSSNWLWSDGRGFTHRWARTVGSNLMSGQAVPVSIAALINPITGESVPCPPGTQIMSDDLDWMTDGWQAVFAIEWKIRQAEHGPEHTWGDWGEIYHGGELDWRRCQRCDAKDSRPWSDGSGRAEASAPSH